MPIFEYKALHVGGKTKTGILDADSAKDARNKLRVQGIHVTSLREMEGSRNKKSFFPKFFRTKSLSDLAMVTRQLATLLESGIPLRESISALIDQVEDKGLQTAFRDIREQITAGKSFAKCLGDHSEYFNNLYVNMVNAGEAAGNIDVVLKKLADYLQAQNRMKGKVGAALAYPIVMMFIGFAVVIFLMTFVVPKIQGVLKGQGKALPLPTLILTTASDFCAQWWWAIIIVVIGTIMVLKLFIATTKGKKLYDQFCLSLPIMGLLFKKQAVSRFAVTLSTLLQSGLPALDALRIVRDIVDNVIMAETIDDVRTAIMDGGDIATPLRKSKVFPPVVGYMMAIGEKSGQLETILTKIAEAYDQEIDITTQKITSIIEPLMIVALSVVVGFIVLAIIMPIMEMSQL